MKLFLNAVGKFICGAGITGLLLFLPAGTWSWANGWLFMGLLFIPMFLAGLVMLRRCPGFLEKRLDSKETQAEQKTVVALNALMFIVGFLLAGLDHRFSWLVVPGWVSIAASVVFLIAYGLYAEVMRENVYLSRTIQVQEGQTVVDTGLYGIVRHPMYAVTLLLFLAIPLILGSLVSFPVFLVYPLILSKRIRNEEQVLKAQLPGYEAYCQKVPYRLIPHLW